MLLNAITKSNYPFTETSTMHIGSGRTIIPGIIYGAILYPVLGVDAIGSAYIAEIVPPGRSPTEFGNLTIRTTAATNISIDVRFYARADDTLVGVCTQVGLVCGCVVASPALQTYMQKYAKLTPDALAFTPSVFQPRRGEGINISKLSWGAAGGVLTVNGKPCNSSILSPSSAAFDSNGIRYRPISESIKKATPISHVFVNGCDTPAEGYHMYLVAGDGQRLIVNQQQSNNTIEIGCEHDYQAR